MDIIVVDFSGVYDFESFASGREIVHVDCRGLNGVDCYCDADGRSALRKTLAPYPAKALHFIDSGDYHYLTEYWVSRLQEPFSLIVLDHTPICSVRNGRAWFLVEAGLQMCLRIIIM